MIRVFEEVEVTHVEGDLDPIRDLEIIFSELVMKDLQVVNGLIDKITPIVNRGIDKSKKFDLEVLMKLKEHLENGEQIRCCQWNGKEIDFLNTLQLLTAKPAIFLANMSEKDFIRQRGKWLVKLKEWIDQHTGEPLIPVSAEMEANFLNMSPEETEEYCTANKTKSQVHKIVTAPLIMLLI
ncbi:hypothetical protein TcBrA4_0100850 [Trypanosoma cruzi]|nr:hypothetical protein TcBrA4_0100850 [Trypanosoma cruzi]